MICCVLEVWVRISISYMLFPTMLVSSGYCFDVFTKNVVVWNYLHTVAQDSSNAIEDVTFQLKRK